MKARIILGCVILASCARDRGAPPEPVPPERVQVLVQADAQLNLSREREPWPVDMTLYLLKGEPKDDLELEALLVNAKEIFGEQLDGEPKQFKAYPGKTDVEELRVTPETTHVVAVAAFIEPIGTYWYQVYEVPRMQSPSDAPCFYLGLVRSEIEGGAFPPPGFDPRAFTAVCPSPFRPQTPSPKKRGRRKKLAPPSDLPASKPPAPPSPPQGVP